MVNTRSTQHGSLQQGRGRGQFLNGNPASRTAPPPTAQHQHIPSQGALEKNGTREPNSSNSGPPELRPNPEPSQSQHSPRAIPIWIQNAQFKTYDGTKDLDDHLHTFCSVMQAQNASDALMCKIFPSTLRGNARTWYYSLQPSSISSYAELAAFFATKFSSHLLIKKRTFELMWVAQREGESLKNYMNRFNDAVLEIGSFNHGVGLATLIQGLKHERFRNSLTKYASATFDEANERSWKFIQAEEYALSGKPTPSKEIKPLTWRDEGHNKKRFKATQNRGPFLPKVDKPPTITPQPMSKQVTWTPFILPRSQILMQIKNKMELRRPLPMWSSLVSKGRPQAPQEASNRVGVGYQQAPPPLPPPSRIIHMITGALEAGGTSSKQQKLYVREVQHRNRVQKRKFDETNWKNQPITFSSVDFDGVITPHNDPLVTSKYDGPIYSFNNQPVPIEGVLKLNVAFDSGRTYVTPSVRFLVVKMASSFNIVIGRPTLIEIRVVVSQSHLCIKFPTPMGVATLKGNQEVARHCYMTSVTLPWRDKLVTPAPTQSEIPTAQQVMGVELLDYRPDSNARATKQKKWKRYSLTPMTLTGKHRSALNSSRKRGKNSSTS
ncbi:hypothetical protein SLEP1_g27630 [Rubroshorea leprosula]|uniref:Retrotransposon gag domain-containing protein n=1 Tax=Rubroshorea leprosula TaxID=152421 RepID=A0AAV5K1T5_9ROSI|nr:hypothetical protein SLEP1_g27630 [Rubroshorea leprosula]